MKLKGIFEKPVKKTNEPFFLRLIDASTYDNSVAVEAVNAAGERLSLICRISIEQGIEPYQDVDKKLGFPMGEDDSVKVGDTTY